jgi:small-conductance mechanosensitive channel
MQVFKNWLHRLKDFLDINLLNIGQTEITLWTLLYFIVLLIGLFYIAGRLNRFLANRLLVRTSLDLGARQAVGTITRYFVVFVGLLIILQSAGINLTTLNVIAGTVGIGIAFGLQNIASNFISGLIILFERPIKVGDRIEISNIEGDVLKIGARSTIVLTNDNIAMIVPNSKFITESVVNWQYNDQKVRFRIPITVAHRSDVRVVERLLLELAKSNPDVLESPEPVVRLVGITESGLNFELRPWSTTLVHRRGKLVSSLYFAIHDAFQEHGINIPSPQLDVRLLGRSELMIDRDSERE